MNTMAQEWVNGGTAPPGGRGGKGDFIEAKTCRQGYFHNAMLTGHQPTMSVDPVKFRKQQS